MVSSTPRPHFTPGKEPVPILQGAGWAPGPNKKNVLFTGKVDLNLRRKLLLHSSVGFYVAETLTLRKVGQKYVASFDYVVLEKEGEDQLERLCEK